ncbi:endopeptidase La [Halopseudomonas bauzanensis]|uniref:Lon protease n=1 Tax=Halopseudomonas bauzanensis TaxID=653930 RepID=A0A031MAS5_9GAMM|nr:endopeptidase La [Halopseudomonas bauzanensis]EZQ17136.1 DNA-binding protein [Halopseudomonas bauzanensis]SES10191.1 ATP-dependent proteinase. Serine peptidase. MEROPS family S16 [Halopseudomonas bauzanensis]SFM09695.1 ATP-dependent Lon protease [Halopseudomonas bauzanensis]
MTTLSDFPLLPLRDVVVYPNMVIPLFVGRDKSIEALEAAMVADKQVLLLAQRNPADDDPTRDALYELGTVATILQLLKLPDGTVKVLVEGEQRARVEHVEDLEGYQLASVTLLEEDVLDEREAQVLVRSLMSQFEQFVNLGKKIPAEAVSSLAGIDDPRRLVDTMAAQLNLKVEQKQAILEILAVRQRVEHVLGVLDTEIDLLQVEKRIRGRVKKQMERSQREYYLNEQMKAIQKEMGGLDEGSSELDELQRKIDASGMSKEALDKANAELGKLKMMSPMSAEATVVRSYIEWLSNVPWTKSSRVRHDLQHAEKVLESDHYGLEEVKERILEYLAVQKRVRKLKGPVLCLVGPPGVGKTSLGESLARATNRKFVRMALGGVRDEAEIRGHRRTYIGSMPGKLIQKMSKAGVKNPLFLLDEIDKMGQDMRGDPSSALLEVLDPEQNHAFSDHYLEVDYDLSDVMFICTSNSMNIPAPLLDRMEVIRIPGYTEDEKINIAQRYLVSKQIKNNGLKKDELTFTTESLRDLIRYYTREAGVRGLERQIAKVCRKVVREQTEKGTQAAVTVDGALLEQHLGVHKFKYGLAEEADQIGQVTGLAWTQVGGELLSIEAAVMPGKGRQIKTGSLGDVMQESISAAMTVVRSRAASLGIGADFHEKHDVHIHVPEGATPKDGPSAGIGMCTALVSALSRIPVRADVAMTGEITLRGQVLPIGGLKEKLLAAHRGGIRTVVIPHDNIKDLREIPDNIKEDIEVIPVKWIDEVLQIALQYMPEPLKEEGDGIVAKEEPHNADAKGRISTH